MKSSYKRDFHHNYLILQDDGSDSCDTYPVRMLINSDIPGLLHCQIHRLDNQSLFYYEITSRQSLRSLCETRKLTWDILVWLIEALLDTMEKMESYLLKPEYLLLKPEYVYISLADKKAEFCCWPCICEDNASFLEFTEYLLPEIDHKDQRAVVLGYDLYRKAMEGQIDPEKIRRELYSETALLEGDFQREKVGKEEKLIPLISEERIEEERRKRQEVLEALTKNEPSDFEKNHPIITAFGVSAVVIVLIVCMYLMRNHYFSLTVFLAIGGCIGLVFVSAGLIVWIKGKKKKRAASKNPECPGENGHEEHIKENRTMPDIEEECLTTQGYEFPDLMKVQETSLLRVDDKTQIPMLHHISPEYVADIPIKQGIIVVGKLEGVADIVLDSAAVSRIHAKIHWDGTNCTLFDLNSKNGTKVNEKEIIGSEGTNLQDGDQVVFGDVVYRYQL